MIAQLNFRTQTLNFSQLERRLNRINQNLRQRRQNGYLRGFVDPNKYDPNELFVDDVDSLDHAQLRREAKEKFEYAAVRKGGDGAKSGLKHVSLASNTGSKLSGL